MSDTLPLRVAITTNTLHVGGAEKQRVMLANGLAARGHEVTLVVLQELGPMAALVDPRVRVWRTRSVTGVLPHRHAVIITGVTNTEAVFATVSRLRSAFRTRWLAVSHSWPSGKDPLYPWALRRLVATADAVAGLTRRHTRALQLSEGWQRHLETLPNGTDFAAGDPPIHGPVARLGYVGRLEPVKGLDRLLRALDRLPPEARWTLHVHGDGSQRSQLEEFTRTRSLPVTWCGRTDDVPRAFASLDLLVIPSRSEALPMVALEALSFGLPVVATAVGALPDVLTSPDSLLDDDEERWPDHLLGLICGTRRREQMREEGLRLSSGWQVPTMVEGYERVLRRLAGPSGAESPPTGRPAPPAER